MSRNTYKIRRTLSLLIIAAGIAIYGATTSIIEEQRLAEQNAKITITTQDSHSPASVALESLAVKGRAPKTNYTRAQFGNGWRKTGDCTTRELILQRDLKHTDVHDCKVYSGKLNDPYTNTIINFKRGPQTSDDIQIDHVVALSDAWQKGAQQLSFEQRESLANDPLELLAVDGTANQQKSDGDAATWLPANKDFRCRYVARQIAVKQKYSLWVTAAEKSAMKNILSSCPEQSLPIIQTQ